MFTISSDKQIKAVLFDLGETLINFGRLNTGELFRVAARRSYAFLQRTGQSTGGFRSCLWRNMFELWRQRIVSRITDKDFDSLAAMKKSGLKKGFKLTDEQWEQFIWLWYEPLRERAGIEDGLSDTLDKLTGMGLKLGIVSNTFVHASSLERHLREEGLLKFFDVRMYSYEFEFRKPDKRIFLTAADRLKLKAENILFVGDRLDTDVKGALRAGMQIALKKAYTNAGRKIPNGVIPIKNISDLPGTLSK